MEEIKDYQDHVSFCEYCGNILTDDGRCPDPECVWNVIIDALAETEE